MASVHCSSLISGKELEKAPMENHVCGLDIAEFSRDLLSVDDPDIIFEVFLECLFNVPRILHLSETDSRR